MDWVPAIDISKWQGRIDFGQMARAGVRAIWVRAANGVTIDTKARGYVAAARTAGIDVGLYTFVRPKLSGTQQADVLLGLHRDVGATLVPQLDVEEDDDLPPSAVAPVVRAMANSVLATLGTAPLIYTGAPFWDTHVKATDLGWCPLWVARYPTTRRPPASPSQWDEWCAALIARRKAPAVPAGWARWDAWQFSAQGNGAGPTYGTESVDLDLNAIRGDAWERLTLDRPHGPLPAATPGLVAATPGLVADTPEPIATTPEPTTPPPAPGPTPEPEEAEVLLLSHPDPDRRHKFVWTATGGAQWVADVNLWNALVGHGDEAGALGDVEMVQLTDVGYDRIVAKTGAA